VEAEAVGGVAPQAVAPEEELFGVKVVVSVGGGAIFQVMDAID